MKKLVLLFLICSSFLFVKAVDLTSGAASAILIEPTTNTIIYELNKDEQRAPASMTKMMTMLLVMEAVDEGRISFDNLVPISKNAASMGGSQVFLQENMEIKVSELLKSVAIASGNDAAVALAEYIAGSTDEFVNMMNQKVSDMGLVNTHFANVHGLDSENHYSSAYDMSQIALELLKHEKILEYTSLYEDYLEKPDGTKTWLVNTNKLVRFYKGVDGLKTGFTTTAMYCLTATAKKNNIRFLTVVMGEPNTEARSADTTAMLNYAFSNYKLNTILNKDDIIDKIDIKRGVIKNIEIIATESVTDLMKQTENKEYSYNITKFNIKAPVRKGDVVGTLEVIDNNGRIVKKIDLTVKEDVKKNNFFTLFKENFKKIVNGL